MIVGDRFYGFGQFDIIEKGDEGDSKIGLVSGIASTEAIDADGEQIMQDGLEWDYFVEKGFVTYEHPLGISNIVGAPSKEDPIVEAKIDGYKATLLKSDLMLEDPVARSVWDKALTLQKSPLDRRFGYSIEGKVVKRSGNIVEKAKIISVAITAAPKNPLTWWEPDRLLNSMMADPGAISLFRAMIGYPQQGVDSNPPPGDIGPLAVQSFQGIADVTGLKRLEMVKELSDDELLAAVFLRSANMRDEGTKLTWAQGLAAIEAIKKKVI